MVGRRPRQGTGTKRTEVTDAFAGQACPAGSIVEFELRGRTMRGKVAELTPRQAVIGGLGERRWRVPYRLLTTIERAGNGSTLKEIKLRADNLLRQYQRSGHLGADWRIALDTSPRRAGSCAHAARTIYLAVGHCLIAPNDEVTDTILHEIAHAIAGARHGHDAHWRRIAAALGCSAKRCTSETHTATRWIGKCGCTKPHHRQVLTRRTRGARCLRCHEPISWRINAEAAA